VIAREPKHPQIRMPPNSLVQTKMSKNEKLLSELNDRSREVFRRVVEGYLTSGDPIGSRTLTRTLSEKISAATVRNVMQDLEHLGLLDSPHTSAGRVPTVSGLRLFVDSLLDIETVGETDREAIDATLGSNDTSVTALLDKIGSTLSDLTRGASLVLAPKHENSLRQIDFVSLSRERALAVLVMSDGHVENRVFPLPPGITASSLREAANFINARIEGRTLAELRRLIQNDLALHQRELDALATDLVERGVALWENPGNSIERLIVRGRANLLPDSDEAAEIERIRHLFDDLERKREIVDFLELTDQGEGVRIFIGSENKLFSLSGSSLVVSPYMNSERKIVGAIGVIGPTRLNYGRIVPIVDYTAQLVGRLLSDRTKG
jgi:heat-inducible transcriptional repressor